MNILIIGGTRNLGHFLTLKLLDAGHQVTLLNRGMTPDDLPSHVERLRADRTIPQQFQEALAGRAFDAVVDFALYKGAEAKTVVELLADRTDHYIFISSGQVYLVREGAQRPFTEASYEGPLTPEPEPNTYDHEEWLYGMEKRRAEDVLARAWAERQFPSTSLRLPMVNSERDHFNRLYGYILRLKDGGPILVPYTPNYPLRHVYVGDVVAAIMLLLTTGKGKGRAYNIAQDETVSLDEFLGLLGELLGVVPRIVKMERSVLEANGFLPDCSPFSDCWMSEMDNRLSKEELGMQYTPLRTYLERLVAYYEADPPPPPVSYRRRAAEQHLALSMG